jgi:phage/plasmid-like protein (TIGR03299 family)
MKIEQRDGIYSLAYDASNGGGWQKPWGIKPELCFAQPSAMSAQEALILSRADFQVSAKPFTLTAGDKTIEAPGHQAIVREDLGTLLGITGDRYVPVQFSEVLGLLDGTSYEVDACAVLGNGEGFYFQARVSTDPVGPKGDRVASYLTGRSSHDGSSGVIIGSTDVRIVCANTLARATIEVYKAIENGVEGSGKAKHTKNVNSKMLDLNKALRAIDEARKLKLAKYDLLARTMVSVDKVKSVIAAAFPNKALDSGASISAENTTAGMTRTLNVRNRVLEIFETGAHETPRDGTAWSAWQAVTAYMSHESAVRGVTGTDAEVTRWLRSTLEGNEPSERALAYLTASVA